MLKYQREPQGECPPRSPRTQNQNTARERGSQATEWTWPASLLVHALACSQLSSQRLRARVGKISNQPSISQAVTESNLALSFLGSNGENSWKLEPSVSREKQGWQTLSSVPTTKRERIKKNHRFSLASSRWGHKSIDVWALSIWEGREEGQVIISPSLHGSVKFIP